MEIIHFLKPVDTEYPAGRYFNNNISYAKAVAGNIIKLSPTKNIALICRGTSGTILCGAIGMLLKLTEYNVIILISRKTSSHGHSMEGADIVEKDKYFTVVVDDFISTGNTINEIVAHLEAYTSLRTFDLLCVSNNLNKERIESWKCKKHTEKIYNTINKFNKVLCNAVFLNY